MIPLVAPTITHIDKRSMKYAVDKGLLHDNLDTVTQFEHAIAEHVEAEAACAVNSGTNALIIALKAAGAQPNDPIRICTYNCRSIAYAVRATTGEQPELVDLTYDIPTAQFEHQGADIAVDLFGSEATERDAWITDITTTLAPTDHTIVASFHRDKLITTGRGGIIAADHDLINECRRLAYYDQHDEPGYSMGMTSMQAQLGLTQLKQLPRFTERRLEIADHYNQRFAGAGINGPYHTTSNYYRYIISVWDAARTVTQLAQHGIEAGRGVNPPLHRTLELDPRDYPGAEHAWQHNLSIPCHPSLSDPDIRHIAETVLQTCAP